MEEKDIERIRQTLSRNKKIHRAYNDFRKRVFSELSPRESEVILYLLPWLLSINDPVCPGYMKNLETPFAIYNIQVDEAIGKREEDFKKMFAVKKNGSLLKPTTQQATIQGLYTIGSTGTISQTSLSDCDVWVCFDKKDFNGKALEHLNRKVNLIKDWMDIHLEMPVYFFISDIAEIKANRFGSVDSESSGSAQQNILKEEFYRTCILICGKTPLWWVSYDREKAIDYNDALAVISDDNLDDNDLVDLGNLEKIKKNEYFGSALWQFNKSFAFPLKSIMKMALLKMLLDAPQDRLICHRFRESIFTKRPDEPFPDSSLFTAGMIFEYTRQTKNRTLLSVLKECFYLKCEIRDDNKSQVLKNNLADVFFKRYPIGGEKEKTLANYASWPCSKQIALGNGVFNQLFRIYRDISSSHGDIVSESDRKDLTILGRKISACHARKKNKVPILQQPGGRLNISRLNLSLEKGVWHVFAGNDRGDPLNSSKDIIFIVTFLVWNTLFDTDRIHMLPNPSNVTIQEIKNLGKRVSGLFGTYKTLAIPMDNYLQGETITKLLIVFGFDRSPWNRSAIDYEALYINCWGELFVRRFKSLKILQNFLKSAHQGNKNIRISRYHGKNRTTYEKTMDQTKAIVFPPFES